MRVLWASPLPVRAATGLTGARGDGVPLAGAAEGSR